MDTVMTNHDICEEKEKQLVLIFNLDTCVYGFDRLSNISVIQ